MRPVRTFISSESLELMGIPAHFASAGIEDYETYGEKNLVAVKAEVKNYVDSLHVNIARGCGLFLFGSNGVGKTMLSCIIGKEAYRHRYFVRRTTLSRYISECAKAWGAGSMADKEEVESSVTDQYKGAELLLLDEVGKEIDSKVQSPLLEDLLRYREDHRKATIICSNLSPKDIKQKYGISCFSLLTGNYTPICIESTDRRAEKYRERV
jgi:DNA replication protein DnaC